MEWTNKIRNKNFMYELVLVSMNLFLDCSSMYIMYYLAILLLAIMITDLEFKAN